MAITEKRAPWLFKGPACELIPAQIEASMTFNGPAPIYINTSGLLKICIDSDSATEVAFQGFVAADQASPDSGTEVFYEQATVNQKWAIYVSHDGADAAAPQSMVQDNLGHSVEAGATPYIGYMTIDTNLSTYASMCVLDIMYNKNTKLVPTLATEPGVAIVRFLQGAFDAKLA